VGSVCEVRTQGARRFEEAATYARAILARCQSENGADDEKLLPRFVGGFAFSDSPSSGEQWRDFASCWMFLPRELYVVKDGMETAFRFVTESGLTNVAAREPVRAVVESPASQGADRWDERVNTVLERIAGGELEKAVLSRNVAVEMPAARDVVSIIDELSRTRCACHTFLVASGDSVFFGSTPELLVQVRGREFGTQAIAGTAPRGRDADDDVRLGEALLASPKNRREQAAVVRGIEESISSIAGEVSADPAPSLIRVPEAFHLLTRISGRLANGESALEVAGALHPTPAVCGTPGPVAARLIEAEEDRGWYTGAVGWLDGDGDGMFVVALRSGLIRGSTVTLWAGAGIVAGSEPEAERLEIEVKLRALGSVLDSASLPTADDEFEAAS
jgi:isochorismate synthase